MSANPAELEADLRAARLRIRDLEIALQREQHRATQAAAALEELRPRLAEALQARDAARQEAAALRAYEALNSEAVTNRETIATYVAEEIARMVGKELQRGLIPIVNRVREQKTGRVVGLIVDVQPKLWSFKELPDDGRGGRRRLIDSFWTNVRLGRRSLVLSFRGHALQCSSLYSWTEQDLAAGDVGHFEDQEAMDEGAGACP